MAVIRTTVVMAARWKQIPAPQRVCCRHTYALVLSQRCSARNAGHVLRHLLLQRMATDGNDNGPAGMDLVLSALLVATRRAPNDIVSSSLTEIRHPTRRTKSKTGALFNTRKSETPYCWKLIDLGITDIHTDCKNILQRPWRAWRSTRTSLHALLCFSDPSRCIGPRHCGVWYGVRQQPKQPCAARTPVASILSNPGVMDAASAVQRRSRTIERSEGQHFSSDWSWKNGMDFGSFDHIPKRWFVSRRQELIKGSIKVLVRKY